MSNEDTLIYYVITESKESPNLAIQANSHEEYKSILQDYLGQYPGIKVKTTKVMTPSEYKRLYH